VADAGPQPAHVPVLLEAVVHAIHPVPTGWLVDGTLGRAGHALAVLRDRPDLSLLGIDQDADALAESAAILAPVADRTITVRARFDQLARVSAEHGASPVVAIVLDLGVSSAQFDRAERGFSYRHDARLDMRMDRDQALSAYEVVNDYDEGRLAAVLRDLGDERYAGRIAKAIVAARPVVSTFQLAEVVRSAIPAPARRRGGHPAKRTFQAVRIEVNEELVALATALDEGIALLAPGGRFAVLSYHSGEDRIVKARFRLAETGGCTCPPGLPCACGAVPEGRLVRRGGITPGPEELAANPRAASARLRIFEKGEQP
jgi:16S rRNA (cytosine1402-N4)-methyltransferase